MAMANMTFGQVSKKGTQVVTQQIFSKLGTCMIYHQLSNNFPAFTLTAPTEISIKIGCIWPRRFSKLFTPEGQTTTYMYHHAN